MGEILGEYKRTLVSASNSSQYNIPIQPPIEIKFVPDLELKEKTVQKEENGFKGVINDVCDNARQRWEELKSYIEDRTENTFVWYASDYVLHVLKENDSDIFWKPNNIKTMAWHPHRNMLAIAFQDHTVHVYEKDIHDARWSCRILQHQFMRGISCLEWKKRTRGTLAVGCKLGVCVWNIDNDPTNRSEEPQLYDGASMLYFSYPGHEDIISISWDPTPASHLLAVASATSGTLVIYDTMTLTSNPLKGSGKGNVLMRWSPNGTWLFVATAGGTSRMWDTSKWRYKDLVNPPGLWVQSACWAPDSRNLFISMHGKNDIHLIFWASSGTKEELLHQKVLSVKAPIEGRISEAKATGIKEIAISPRDGKRLAVIFDDSKTVVLYAVDIPALPALGVSCGLHRIDSRNPEASDHPTGEPVHIAYSSFDSSSSTLAILHKDGKVNFIHQVV